MRILQSGGRIPAIYSNEAAQKNLQQALSLLQQSIQNILLFVKARQTLMSNFLNTVLQASQTEVLKNTTLASVKPNAPIMEQGAIAKA